MIFTENQIYLLNLATQILREEASALAMLGECKAGRGDGIQTQYSSLRTGETRLKYQIQLTK